MKVLSWFRNVLLIDLINCADIEFLSITMRKMIMCVYNNDILLNCGPS